MFLYNETNISLNKLTNNVLNISLQIRTMALRTRHLSKGTAVLNEISIEYDISEPSYIVKSLGKHQELAPFQATCEIFKNKITVSRIGEPAPRKSLQSKMQQLKFYKCK